MAKKVPPVREIKYADFDEMQADVDSLLQNGYTSHGNWTLGQACGHVTEWMRFPMDGFPKPPLPMRMMFGAMRMTGMAKKMAGKILEGGFKPGIPTAPETVPDAEKLTDEQGVAKLRETIDRLKNFDGQLIESPLFGQMDMATHTKVSLLHGAHHFGYLNPKS